MNPKQKSFLDDLAALFRQYNIDHVHPDGGAIEFVSNGIGFKVRYYHTIDGEKEEFVGVTTTLDYKPDDHSAIEYSGEENFDD